jgi:hypothetical protein
MRGYIAEMNTRPQTIGYGSMDPVGLVAWMLDHDTDSYEKISHAFLGERLHAWMAGNGTDSEIDVAVRRDVDASVGAAVIGRRTFDLGVGPWGGTPWPGVPSFVVTRRASQDLLGNNVGTFAFDGLQAAVRRAREAAGTRTSCWAREHDCSMASRPS